MIWADLIIILVTLYASVGALFGLAFVFGGVQRVDHAAAGAHWSFRLFILPGTVALWPLLWKMWSHAKSRDKAET